MDNESACTRNQPPVLLVLQSDVIRSSYCCYVYISNYNDMVNGFYHVH